MKQGNPLHPPTCETRHCSSVWKNDRNSVRAFLETTDERLFCGPAKKVAARREGKHDAA
jgi:hypothetical protein